MSRTYYRSRSNRLHLRYTKPENWFCRILGFEENRDAPMLIYYENGFYYEFFTQKKLGHSEFRNTKDYIVSDELDVSFSPYERINLSDAGGDYAMLSAQEFAAYVRQYTPDKDFISQAVCQKFEKWESAHKRKLAEKNAEEQRAKKRMNAELEASDWLDKLLETPK